MTGLPPPVKPWRAAAWTLVPGGVDDAKHTGFPDAHKATVWARKQRQQRNRRAVVWHVDTLPPAEIRSIFPDLEPDAAETSS